MAKKKEIYISVDIETAGPNPGNYALLSLGACHVYDPSQTFYVELKPINSKHIPSALEITGMDWNKLLADGQQPQEAMSQFAEWVEQTTPAESTPVFVAFNAPFDWMFVNDYFHRYLGRNPFGHKALDIKSFYMGLKCVSWNETGMRHLAQKYLKNKTLSHNALQDALDQAEIFRKLMGESKIIK
jgi:DNA polymerase III epsilon subunit-like protein